MTTSTLKPSRKPAISPKPKLHKCRVCQEKFQRSRSIQPTCGKIACQLAYGKQVAAKSAEKRMKEKKRAEVAQIKARKDAIKTRSDHVREAQEAFNAYRRAVAKQAGYDCISSGKPLDWNGNGVDAGHYRSIGSAPHLRFDERNVHAQSKHDNRYLAGNAVDYRIGLIKRIGLAEVEALEADQTPRKWSIDDLKAIKAEYKAKLKALAMDKGEA
jgi:hypothetical protein